MDGNCWVDKLADKIYKFVKFYALIKAEIDHLALDCDLSKI